ncbi:MAG: hypothetical protein ABI542_00175 [Gemmatimonadota bacterium]
MSIESLKAALADRYTIERELGHGGMATVLLAKDITHHRTVAIKALHPDRPEAAGQSLIVVENRLQELKAKMDAN